MNLYRYILRPQSPWATPLRSDTLQGLILWRIAERDGPEACLKTIDEFRQGRPPFLLSSVLPENQIFRPLLPPLPRKKFRDLAEQGKFKDHSGQSLNTREAMEAYKKFRKEDYMPLRLYLEQAAKLDAAELFARHLQEPKQTEIEQTKDGLEPHVTIERHSGGSLSGGLFFNRLKYFKRGLTLHLYARTAEPERLLELLALVGDLGFGRDASTGKGRFSVELDKSFQPQPLEAIAGSDQMLLSVGASDDLAGLQGWYAVDLKNGKTGAGISPPFKNPILMLREGSVLRTPPQGSWILSNIHPNPAVVQITWPLTLPCQVL